MGTTSTSGRVWGCGGKSSNGTSCVPYIQDCFVKPTANYRKGLEILGIPVHPDFCVDDHPELIKSLGGEAVKPYYWADTRDKEMLRIYDAITEFARSNTSSGD